MFERALMFFCCILFCQLATAQVCYDYPCVIAKIKKAIEKADYNTAFDNLESASKYRNSDAEEISQLRKQLFVKINQEKIKAQQEEEKSRRLLQQVQAESQRAESAEADVDRLAEEKAKQEKLEKLRIENAEIAAHNRKLADSVKGNDPSLALNILKYNLDNFPEDELTRTSYNTLSQRVQNEIACIAVSPKIAADLPFDNKTYKFKIQSVALSKDGKRCFWAFYDRIMLWDVLEDTVSVVVEDEITDDIKVDSSGQKIIYLNGNQRLVVVDLKNNQSHNIRDAVLVKSETEYYSSSGLAVDFIPMLGLEEEESIDTPGIYDLPIVTYAIENMGQFCIIGAGNGAVHKWDFNENKVYEFRAGHYEKVRSISIAEKSPFVLTGSDDGIARLWRTNVQDNRTIQAYLGHKHSIYEVALAPDRSICISLSMDRTMKWWDVETGRVIRSAKIEKKQEEAFGLPSQVQFTSDGSHVLMSNNLGSISVWNLKGEAKTYEEIAYPYAIAEKTILSVGQDGLPRLFQIRQLGHCENNACKGYMLTHNDKLVQKGVLLKKELDHKN